MNTGLPLIAWAVYLAGITAMQRLTGAAWSDAVVLDPAVAESWLLRIGVVIPTTMAGLALAYVVPAWPWAQRRFAGDRLAALAAAVVAAVLSHAIGTTLLKVAGVTITRPVLLGLIACTSIVWIAAARRVPSAAMPPLRAGVIISMVVGAGVWLLWDKIALEAFSGDGMEAFALASSLNTAVFPTWDLELTDIGPWTWHLAHPPVTAFVHHPAVVLLGAAEGTVRSVHVLALAAGMAATLCWLPRRESNHSSSLHELAVVALWLPTTVCALYYSGLDAFSDLGKCGELLVLLGGLSAGALVMRGHGRLALIVAVLTCGLRWYAPMYMLAGAGAFAAVGLIRWRQAASLAAAVVTLAAVAGGVFVAVGQWPLVTAQFEYEHLGLLAGAPAYRASLPVILAHLWLYSAGLLPLLVLTPWWDRTGRALALVTLAYTVFTLRSTLVASHFLTPIALLPGLAALRHVAQRVGDRGWVVSGIAAAVLATAVLWPSDPRIVTAPRDLGRQTCLVAPTEPAAVALARAVLPELLADTTADVGPHVLAWYAADHDDGRCYFLATRAADGTPHLTLRGGDAHRPVVDGPTPSLRLRWLRRVLTGPAVDQGEDER